VLLLVSSSPLLTMDSSFPLSSSESSDIQYVILDLSQLPSTMMIEKINKMEIQVRARRKERMKERRGEEKRA